MHGPTSHFYFSQRLRLHYVDWGNEGAPPLLLVHGGRDHCRNWDWVAERLRDRYHIIAPDLRGHGDSAWAVGGGYDMSAYLYDIAQLVHQKAMAPVTIISHSMGAGISLNYCGAFPDQVKKIVAIEGLGPSPEYRAQQRAVPYPERLAEWIEKKRKAAGRTPRKYESIEAAFHRMIEENSYLTETQARHLTVHGVNKNEDGTYSWKFDPHLNVWPIEDVADEFLHQTWGAITAPTLLLYGADSWASNPEKDGRAMVFNDYRVIEFENAGHWLHHDQFDRFMREVRAFL